MYQQSFQMRIAVVLASVVMFVVFAEGRQFFQPLINVFDQSALVVIHIDSRRDVHGGNQHDSILNARFLEDGFDLRRDVNVSALGLCMKRQIFGVDLH